MSTANSNVSNNALALNVLNRRAYGFIISNIFNYFKIPHMRKLSKLYIFVSYKCKVSKKISNFEIAKHATYTHLTIDER